MIILSIILLTISFLFQGVISNVIGYTPDHLSIFYTIYPLITIMAIYPHFENQNKFLIILVVVGLLTDLVYANTLIFNTCLFYAIYKMNQAFHFFFPYNLFTTSVSNLLSIYVYHCLTVLFLVLLNFDNYNLTILVKAMINSTLVTIIFTIITYLLVNFIKQRFDLKEVK